MTKSFNEYYHSYFPECLFPVAPELLESYRNHVESGFNIASESRLLVCGTVRDAAENFAKNAIRIDRLGSYFKEYAVYLYENDSIDGTPDLIRQWSQNKRVGYQSDRLGIPKHDKDMGLARCKAMADCRNKVLNYVKSVYHKYDYVILYDMDISGGFSCDGVFNSLSHMDLNKDVITSNGVFVQDERILFFDTWPFIKLSGEIMDPVEANLQNFPRGTELVEIQSGFGGLSLYKSSIFSHSALRYIARENECDHVSLCRGLRERGYRIWLNPSQIVLYNSLPR